MLTIVLLFRKQGLINNQLRSFLVSSLLAGAAAELIFTGYTQVDDVTNMAGHLLKFISYFFIYRALVRATLSSPYCSLYRELVLLNNKLRNRAEELRNEILHREKMEQEIFRLQSLNLIGEMAAGMAHEIRNPLTSVRGYLQYYGMKSDLEQYKEPLSLLIDELDRANGIITDFLSLSKNKAIDLRALDINAVVTAALPLMHTTALMYNHRIVTDLSDVPEILADEKELRQCLLNFVTNGLEVMSNSGTLLISTFLDYKNRIVLCIRDEGHGIPEHIRGKIGTPFLRQNPTERV